PFSIDRFGDNVMYLAHNRMGQFQVALLQGATSSPVSTPEVEYDLNQLQVTALNSATAYSYLYFGHLMYQINFPTKSYLYDGTSNAWSEVGSNPLGVYPPGRHYGDVRFELASIAYVCDYRNGNIYKVDANNYTDNGDPIIFEADLKHVFEPNLGFQTIDEFQIDMETGVGLNGSPPTPGVNPVIMFSVSRDGGRTFGNERQLAIGPIGAYSNKCFALGVGCSRDFVAKLKISDPVKRALVNPQLRVR